MVTNATMLYFASPARVSIGPSSAGNSLGASGAFRHNISMMRQRTIELGFDPRPGISVSTLAYEYPADYQVPEHAHGSDQLIYAVRGVMEVFSDQNMWLIPPQFAIWIP